MPFRGHALQLHQPQRVCFPSLWEQEGGSEPLFHPVALGLQGSSLGYVVLTGLEGTALSPAHICKLKNRDAKSLV